MNALHPSPSGGLQPLLRFWAKLGGTHTAGYHPVICHVLDVAAAAQVIWDDVLGDGPRNRMAEGLGCDRDDTRAWAIAVVGLHDLGKLCPVFQLRPEVGPRLRERLSDLPAAPPLAEAPHGQVTATALPELLVELTACPRMVARDLAAIAGAHHGTFASHAAMQSLLPSAIGQGPWQDIRRAHTALVLDLLGVFHARAPTRISAAAAMILAGLTSVADWVGSAAEFFPYFVEDTSTLPPLDPRGYYEKALVRAQRALDAIGWAGWRLDAPPDAFGRMFPGISEPRPLQRSVEALARQITGPALIIVEAPMGEGKTEAALYLAEHLGWSGGHRGAYVALPTQATSNQMFGRMAEFLERRYLGSSVALILLHGHASLSAEFQLLLARGRSLVRATEVYGEDESAAGVRASTWFTYRKRGLLTPFGVGTIDQALLGALQTFHGFVRLFALSQKVVIVDEVHAYDCYMSALLERLLEWLGALGTSTVLLSATLPPSRRHALRAAYARGAGRAIPVDEGVPYPRVSWQAGCTGGAVYCSASSQTHRDLGLQWVDASAPDADDGVWPLAEALRTALEEGGCAAVVCNTVARAQQVYRALHRCFPANELDLFHARFLYGERDSRERRALARFGRSDHSARPFRAVLVATQVIEQSLDLDFDLLVSDLAPLDLLLQRAGRLHRHGGRFRPRPVARPALWVATPEVGADGTPRFADGDEAVYDRHTLLRTWLALRNRGRIGVPEDVEPLIAATYEGSEVPAGLSEPLRSLWEGSALAQAQARDAAQVEAEARWIKRPDFTGPLWRVLSEPRDDDAPELHPVHQALTRLAEPSVTVVCLQRTSAGVVPVLSPDCPVPDSTLGIDAIRALLTSSVTLTDRRVVHTLLAREVPAAWQQSALLRYCRALELDEHRRTRVGRWLVTVDPAIGVTLTASEP
jgi:CRISPR-associated endonuclease/helicase Cas3